jgi:hypothetical protein
MDGIRAGLQLMFPGSGHTSHSTAHVWTVQSKQVWLNEVVGRQFKCKPELCLPNFGEFHLLHIKVRSDQIRFGWTCEYLRLGIIIYQKRVRPTLQSLRSRTSATALPHVQHDARTVVPPTPRPWDGGRGAPIF